MPLTPEPPVRTSIRVRRETASGRGRVFGLIAAGKHGAHTTSIQADIELEQDDVYFTIKRLVEDLVGAQATWSQGDDQWSLTMGHTDQESRSTIITCLHVETLSYDLLEETESPSHIDRNGGMSASD